MTEQINPGIVFGSETWLNQNIGNKEFLPQGYTAYRKDRKDGYGGTLIAVRDTFSCQELLTSSSEDDTEITVVKIEIPKEKPLILVAAYRPPSANLEKSSKLCDNIESLAQRHKGSVFWLGGDLNLPDINWETNSIIGNQNLKSINERFLQMIVTIHSEQMVLEPTRNENVLDLFVTNRPSLINRLEVIPGLSDHKAVLINSSIKAPRIKPQARKKNT